MIGVCFFETSQLRLIFKVVKMSNLEDMQNKLNGFISRRNEINRELSDARKRGSPAGVSIARESLDVYDRLIKDLRDEINNTRSFLSKDRKHGRL